MINQRTYGTPPFRVAVIHGGPGACGEMAPVARELSSVCGVLEPIQTATTLEGQIDELATVLEECGGPFTLIGHSWGAWLSYFVAAYHSELVRKLILVGSGPYEQKYVELIREAQMNRLNDAEKAEYESILALLNGPADERQHDAYMQLGALLSRADTCDPLPPSPDEGDSVDAEGRSYHGVLAEVQRMRQDGLLLELAHRIACPVVALHGDCDTRPIAGVEEPLSSILPDFRMIVLRNCGHDPWKERQARDEFYRILRQEINIKEDRHL
ncbi:MAG: alpha/beta hydrolase [Armatimonadota bacterium]|nr:alpha/beta hydrolase [bacterium]